ncbi:hypothetical protein CBR_g44281 [Chara braunii]|uniref:Protoporphyrinogen oxidase n=1 Tax=Chara braunii TaxID=69332 RepID=A0A388K2Z3_CHABU|nr:hypothetical protein CBR_g44281 [Chara braunii]|eukprot:GBG64397.1 hypothetical protein CBR_g44281 [Chara braunii]
MVTVTRASTRALQRHRPLLPDAPPGRMSSLKIERTRLLTKERTLKLDSLPHVCLLIAMDKKGGGAAIGSVAVIGAGVSGLAAAFRFRKEGVAVTVFEAEVPGGVIQTEGKDGFLWEKGPNTMAENHPVVGQVISELQLQQKIAWPADQSKRYTVRNGKAVMLPASPLGFLTTEALSPQAKLRVLMEPFLWRRRGNSVGKSGGAAIDEDESVGDFLERHVGKEPVDYLVDPFLAGTAGSDPQSIAVKYGLRGLWELEQRHGSLFVGALAGALSKLAKKASARTKGVAAAPDSSKLLTSTIKGRTGSSFSFLGGMQTLPNALMERVGRDRVRTGCAVVGLDGRVLTGAKPERWEWKVSYTQRANKNKKRHEMFDAVLVTAPLHKVRNFEVVKAGKKFPLDWLPQVKYAALSVIVQAFRLEDIKRPLPGFGVLVPSKEQDFRTLGTIFSSSMFSDRVPPGYALFSSFMGGTRDQQLAGRPAAELQKLAFQDLKRLIGVEGNPVLTRHICWPQAFPVYGKGYGAVLKAMETMERDLPGVYFAGNHRNALSVGKALQSGYEAAGNIVEDLKSRRSGNPVTVASALPPPGTCQETVIC